MKTLVKTSFKLLLRAKAFWFFLLLTPMLSTLMLKIKTDSSAAFKDERDTMAELSKPDEKVAYHGTAGEYVVKVYDASGSELSDYYLDKLAATGMFVVCRVHVDANVSIDEYLDRDGHEDKMGEAMYIAPEFDEIITGEDVSGAVTLYRLSDDARNELLENTVTMELNRINILSKGGDALNALQAADALVPTKQVVSLAGESERNLSVKQVNQRTQMGYAFSFLTLGFVFCGIFVAHTAIKEQKNGVLTRINLTNVGTPTYFLAKFITVFIVSLAVTGVMAACSLILNTDDLGMDRVRFIAMIFLMGLIFSSLSMMIGVLVGEVMSANVAAFTLWCMSSLLSGLYFPLTYTSPALKMLSNLMPQKWFLTGTEMIFVGDNHAFGMLLCTTVAFLAVILSLGGLGLRIKKVDQWGSI